MAAHKMATSTPWGHPVLCRLANRPSPRRWGRPEHLGQAAQLLEVDVTTARKRSGFGRGGGGDPSTLAKQRNCSRWM